MDPEIEEDEEIVVPESPPLSPSCKSSSQALLLSKLTNEQVKKLDADFDNQPSTSVACMKTRNGFASLAEQNERKGDDVCIDMEVDEEEMTRGSGVAFESRTNERFHRTTARESFSFVLRNESERKEEVRKMPRLDPNQRIFPDVKVSNFHAVAFNLKTDYKFGDELEPYPSTYAAKWDPDWLVALPCDPFNRRIIKINTQTPNESGNRFRQEKVWLWRKIEEALSEPILSCADFLRVLQRYTRVRGLPSLEYCLDSVMTPPEREHFFQNVMPFMKSLCLRLREIVTCSLPLLRRNKNMSISLSQKQIACLLANAFFCTFPKPRRAEEDTVHFPSFDFIELFQCHEDDSQNTRLHLKAHKIRCIIHYFERIAESSPKGVVTFTRKSMKPSKLPDWENSTKKLTKIVPLVDGTIEDDGTGMLQVDFANKFVGGGVFGNGAVQEEILFCVYPELLVSRLFTEKLFPTEALLVTGCERFSFYTGYSTTFRFDGDYIDMTPVDPRGRRCCQFIAMDALYISKPLSQFSRRSLCRELDKAYVGFSSPGGSNIPVATGKWGCGAFNGDPQLKAVLQLLAASEVGRDVVFFTFSDFAIQQQIEEMYSILKDYTISGAFALLNQYTKICCSTGIPTFDLYGFILRFGGNEPPKKMNIRSEIETVSKLPEVPIDSFYSKESEEDQICLQAVESMGSMSDADMKPVKRLKGDSLPNLGRGLTSDQITDILYADDSQPTQPNEIVPDVPLVSSLNSSVAGNSNHLECDKKSPSRESKKKQSTLFDFYKKKDS